MPHRKEYGMATIHTPGDGLSDTKSLGWPRYTPRAKDPESGDGHAGDGYDSTWSRGDVTEERDDGEKREKAPRLIRF